MKSAQIRKEFLAPKFLALMSCNIFLLRQVEKREDENSCYVLDIQEFGFREISVFAMGLSRNISLCDKDLLPGRIGGILASTWSVHLVP